MAKMNPLITGPALLFAPAHRPELLPKAAARADMTIVDLEDGAGQADRAAAREVVRNSALDPVNTIIRVGGPDQAGFAEDVAMVRESPYRLVMVPKLTDHIPTELAGLQVIAMVETPQAVINLPQLVEHEDVVGLFWGAEDLTALLGGTHARFQDDEAGTGSYRDVLRLTRSQVLVHAAAAGKFAIDAIYADFQDEAGQRAEAVDAARSGFVATACIHPRQVSVVREAYRPEAEQVRWARQVITGAGDNDGAFQVAGAMVDAPIVAQAQRILRRAEG